MVQLEEGVLVLVGHALRAGGRIMGPRQGTFRVSNILPAFWPKIVLCVMSFLFFFFVRPCWAQG